MKEISREKLNTEIILREKSIAELEKQVQEQLHLKKNY